MKRYILPSLFVIFYLSLTLTQIITTDTWWNLSDGRAFFSNGRLPATDPYSYVTEGKVWANGSWLSGVLLYPVYLLGGGRALVLLQVFIVALVFFLLQSIRTRKFSRIAFISLALCLLTAEPRYQVRAELFGLLSAAIFLWLLFQYQYGLGISKVFLGFILTMIFWVNTHASFPLGLLLIGIFLAGELLTSLLVKKGRMISEMNPLSTKRQIWLAGILVALLIATGITPYGYAVWKIPIFFHEHGKFVRENLSEWVPLSVDWFRKVGPVASWAIVLSIIGAVSGIILNMKRASLSWVFIWIFSLAMFISSVRHVGFFAMATLPILLLNWSNILEQWQTHRLASSKTFQKSVIAAACVFMVFVSFDQLTDRGVLQRASYQAFGLGFYERTTPKEAISFVKLNNLPSNIFNSYDLGSYLMFHWPERKVFIDTRMWFRGAEDFKNYIDLMREPEKYWGPLVEKYGIETVILKHLSRETDVLIPYLFKHPEWATVFCDARGIIFLKRTPTNETLVQKLSSEVDLDGLFERTEREYRPHWFWQRFRWFRPREIPFELYWVAHLYFQLEMYDQAEKAFLRVLEYVPDLHDGYFFLGKIAAKRKDFKSAVEMFEKTVALNPDFLPAQTELKMSKMLAGFRVIHA